MSNLHSTLVLHTLHLCIHNTLFVHLPHTILHSKSHLNRALNQNKLFFFHSNMNTKYSLSSYQVDSWVGACAEQLFKYIIKRCGNVQCTRDFVSYVNNCSTYDNTVLICVFRSSVQFLLQIFFRSGKYLATYAGDVCRNAYRC